MLQQMNVFVPDKISRYRYAEAVADLYYLRSLYTVLNASAGN